MFYDKFEALCTEHKISVTKALTEIGLSRALGTKWKTTGAMPNGTTLAKISKYFNVPVDYFTSGTLTDAMIKAMRSLPDYEDPMEMLQPETVDDVVKFALFGDVDVDDAVYDEVKRFAEFAKAQHEKGKK